MKNIPQDDDDDRLEWQKAPAALRAAVEKLCADASVPVASLEQKPLSEVFALACATYGRELPEFWRIWQDWRDDQVQPMGEL